MMKRWGWMKKKPSDLVKGPNASNKPRLGGACYYLNLSLQLSEFGSQVKASMNDSAAPVGVSTPLQSRLSALSCHLRKNLYVNGSFLLRHDPVHPLDGVAQEAE